MSVEQEIADLEALLNTGASSVGAGSQRTTWDLNQVRRRLAELRRQQNHMRRPRISTIDLSRF